VADKAAKDKAAKDAVKNAGANVGTGGTGSKVKGLSDYTQELRDAIGTDPLQAKLMERMDKMDAASAKSAEQAPWLALAQAGFEMANSRAEYGKGQSIGADIGRGALAGIKSYGDAKQKSAELEDKHFALMADMAKAKRAEDIAIATKGADSRDAQLAREQQTQIHRETMANNIYIHQLDNFADMQKTLASAAAKDQPNAVDRATKIKPLIVDHPDYKPKMKALIDKLGDKSVEPGSPKYNEYLQGKAKIESEIYNDLISKPGAGTTGAQYNYVPGKGIMPF
jgi:hypothetical protein